MAAEGAVDNEGDVKCVEFNADNTAPDKETGDVQLLRMVLVILLLDYAVKLPKSLREA